MKLFHDKLNGVGVHKYFRLYISFRFYFPYPFVHPSLSHLYPISLYDMGQRWDKGGTTMG